MAENRKWLKKIKLVNRGNCVNQFLNVFLTGSFFKENFENSHFSLVRILYSGINNYYKNYNYHEKANL